MRGRRRPTAGAGLLLGALALTGCATANSGSAAVVGEVTIPETLIGEQLRSVNEATGLPPETPNTQLTQSIVSYDVGYELVRQTSDVLGVSVTPSDLDRAYNDQVDAFGGEEELFAAAAQQGIPPGSVRQDLETQLLVERIVQRAAPGITDPQVQQTALLSALTEVARGVGIEVAPKYGQWDDELLQITAPADPVSRAPGPATPVLPGQ